MSKSSIEWTQVTWNPTTGCSKISAGCKFCYAEVMSKRLQAMGQEKYKLGFKLTIHNDTLQIPYKWRKPRIVFVNSMSDLFHEDIPDSFINDVFQVMNDNQHHTFQILTKRAERIPKLSKTLNWTPNIWLGVSVEDYRVMNRISFLKKSPAITRFLSCEPLLGPLPALNLKDIHWVIVGGESGHNPRPMEKTWVLDIQRQCQQVQVPFFFKQWGGRQKKRTGRLLNGKVYDEMPG